MLSNNGIEESEKESQSYGGQCTNFGPPNKPSEEVQVTIWSSP